MLLRVIMVVLFIGSLVIANLLVTAFGPWALPITAFFMIGFDLTARDVLHEAWLGRGIAWKMPLLIASGAVIAYLMNRSAFWIGIASFVAFASAQTVDTAVYQALLRRSWILRANASNAASSFTDSLLFTLVAFHTWLPWIILSQFAIKLVGGFGWSLLLSKLRGRWREAA